MKLNKTIIIPNLFKSEAPDVIKKANPRFYPVSLQKTCCVHLLGEWDTNYRNRGPPQTQRMKMPSEVTGQKVRAAREDGREETVSHDELH